MKLTYLLLIIATVSFKNIYAQKNNFLIGTVIKYSVISHFKHTIIDTVVGQSRTLTIDTIAKKIWIQWQIKENIIPMIYNIASIKNSINYNQTTKKNEPYLLINCFDEDDYPLMIMISKDYKYVFLYYFYNNEEKSFKKSEKIEVKEIISISL